jgi:holliday junction DNA helicase RuvB
MPSPLSYGQPAFEAFGTTFVRHRTGSCVSGDAPSLRSLEVAATESGSSVETSCSSVQNRAMDAPSTFAAQPLAAGEESFEKGLRPQDFAEFLGQETLLEPLRLMIRAAKERGDTLEHLLFSGLPGLGKTSLAFALAKEIDAPIKVTSGPALERAKDMVGILSQLEAGSILFIDEIHRLPRIVEEYLYGAMERFQIEFTLDQGVNARLLKLDIQPFTLVGATTREAMLTAAFRSRFGHSSRFEPYEPEALCEILGRSAQILAVSIADSARTRLAENARGVPRIANRLLRRARDVAQLENDLHINDAVVARTFGLLGIDAHGLERADLRLLECLAQAQGRPLGLKSLSVSIGEAEDTIEDVLEPWLIRKGYLARTPQGRTLLEGGRLLLNRSTT